MTRRDARRLALVADIHAGNHARFGGEVRAGINRRAQAVLDTLARALQAAYERDVVAFIIAGDLFDTSSPTPQLVAAVGALLGRFARSGKAPGMSIIVVRGNHDMVSDTEGDHALGPLKLIPDVHVVEAPELLHVMGFELLLVPFMPGDARVWLPSSTEKLVSGDADGEGRRVLVSHVGVIDQHTPAFLRKAHDAVELDVLRKLATRYGIRDTWVGNWHEHRKWEGEGWRVGQVSALAPTGFDNPGPDGYGVMVVLDTAGGFEPVMVPGPRFIKGDPGDLVPDGGYAHWSSPAYVELHGFPEDMAEQRADLAAAIADGRVAAGVVIEHADPLFEEVAADGAAEARKASTLEEALTAFADTVELPAGVDRDDVRARAQRYLANVNGNASTGGTPGDVRRLDLLGFATHVEGTRVDLPERGLVVVTGANGAGKSTLLDGVATALWNDTLRGDPLWRAGEPGSVGITTSAVEAARLRTKGGKCSLDWGPPVVGSLVTYENATKAQQAIEAVIGTMSTWRRTSVLSSVDSDTFTRSSDAERKRLLEVFLGLDRFDRALLACRGDVKMAAAGEAKWSREHAVANAAHVGAAASVDAAQKAVDGFVEEQGGKTLAELDAEVDRLTTSWQRASRDQQAHVEARARLREKLAAARSTVDGNEAKAKRIGDLHVCPTCAQGVGPEHKREVREAAAKAVADDRAALVAVEADIAEASAGIEELAELVASLARKTGVASDLRSRARANAGAKARAEKALADARYVHERSAAAVTASKAALDTHAEQLAVLQHVEAMLGTRGVRSLVLTRALKGLEGSANRWLSRFPTDDGPMRVRVSGTTERASGDAADVISVKVAKARAPDVWRSYASCSGGERRRLDIAFLFALRELAQAAHGPGGTLWCDEVFDALDAQGAQDVASALVELARERAVIVITHNPELLAYLRPTLHLHVGTTKNGATVEVRRSA